MPTLLSAFQGITISAPNGDVNITGKNVTISANNSLKITSGETIKDRFYYQKEWKDSKVKAYGTAFIADAWDSFRTNVIDKFIDLSFLRCVLEAFLRPVDGTLQIKSYTFIQMEAGTGATEIPHDSLVFPDSGLIPSANLKTSDDNLQKLVKGVPLLALEPEGDQPLHDVLRVPGHLRLDYGGLLRPSCRSQADELLGGLPVPGNTCRALIEEKRIEVLSIRK